MSSRRMWQGYPEHVQPYVPPPAPAVDPTPAERKVMRLTRVGRTFRAPLALKSASTAYTALTDAVRGLTDASSLHQGVAFPGNAAAVGQFVNLIHGVLDTRGDAATMVRDITASILQGFISSCVAAAYSTLPVTVQAAMRSMSSRYSGEYPSFLTVYATELARYPTWTIPVSTLPQKNGWLRLVLEAPAEPQVLALTASDSATAAGSAADVTSTELRVAVLPVDAAGAVCTITGGKYYGCVNNTDYQTSQLRLNTAVGNGGYYVATGVAGATHDLAGINTDFHPQVAEPLHFAVPLDGVASVPSMISGLSAPVDSLKVVAWLHTFANRTLQDTGSINSYANTQVTPLNVDLTPFPYSAQPTVLSGYDTWKMSGWLTRSETLVASNAEDSGPVDNVYPPAGLCTLSAPP